MPFVYPQYKSPLFDDIYDKLFEFFKGDRVKIDTWLHLDNPLLGGISPHNMLLLDRDLKLYSFVMSSLGDNYYESV